MPLIDSLIGWTNKVFAPHGSLGLFTLAFVESSFFPIPPDILLIALSLAEPSKAWWFALIATIGSVLGSLLGYGIGYMGKKVVLEKFISKNRIEKVHNLFNKYEAGAIFIAGFTPIPYKVFTIAAGVFYINIKKMIVAAFFGRGLRFFLEAVLIVLFGKAIMEFLRTTFNWFTLAGAILLIISYFICKKSMKKRRSKPLMQKQQQNTDDNAKKINIQSGNPKTINEVS